MKQTLFRMKEQNTVKLKIRTRPKLWREQEKLERCEHCIHRCKDVCNTSYKNLAFSFSGNSSPSNENLPSIIKAAVWNLASQEKRPNISAIELVKVRPMHFSSNRHKEIQNLAIV